MDWVRTVQGTPQLAVPGATRHTGKALEDTMKTDETRHSAGLAAHPSGQVS